MGLWDGLESAEIFESGQYFEPGQWIVEINRCLTKRSRKSGQDLFLVECVVITSNLPSVSGGARRTWCQPMKNRNVAMNAVKDFMVSIFDLPREDKDWLKREFDPYIVKTMDRITGTAPFLGENPLAGRLCNLSTWHKNKQDKPSEVYTVHDWEMFDYASIGKPLPPDWNSIRVATQAPAAAHFPTHGFFASAAPAIPPGAQVSPDGKFFWNGTAWLPVPAPVAALPPPPPVAAPAIPPGAQVSPDGKFFWNGTAWLPAPVARW